MEILSMVVTYALVYAASNTSLTVPTINYTAVNELAWWGPADKESNQDTSITSTSVTFSDDLIDDLKMRLTRNVSYEPALENSAFTYGFNRDQLAYWTNYWANVYNFSARQKALNAFPMYKTNIQGLDIFYIRYTPKVSANVAVVPLLLLHGFPLSPIEFYDAIPYLTAVSDDRDYVVELIIPCLPGFGYSEGSVRTGFGAAQSAVVLRNLMKRLNYTHYYVSAEDFGDIIAGHMATLYPDEVLGYHSTWPRVLSPVAVLLQFVGALFPPFLVNSNVTYERTYPLFDIFRKTMNRIAYVHWQATKPETAGIVMADSASGLLAYYLETMFTGTDASSVNATDGLLYKYYNPDSLLDNFMFYWAPNSFVHAFRVYAESFTKAQFLLRLDEIPTYVPTWGVQDKNAISYQPPVILKLKYKNLLNTEVLTNGGQHLAMEQPEIYSSSVLKAITAFREWHSINDLDY